ncbi:MAG TPA: amylo-alpha-1,6-glucosidase [Chloroflexota bacterium]
MAANLLIRKIPVREPGASHPDELLAREWLVTNGLGGYASGTVMGTTTRRYHGVLIAALPAPRGRQVMLNYLAERLRLDDETAISLEEEELPDAPLDFRSASHLTEIRLEAGLPVWRYQVGKIVLEKRLIMPHMQNTVMAHYRLVSGAQKVNLELPVSVHFRSHEAEVSTHLNGRYIVKAEQGRYELFQEGSSHQPLRLLIYGEETAFTMADQKLMLKYRTEEARGYPAIGELDEPGYFRVELAKGQDAALIASTEAWDMAGAMTPQETLDSEFERRRRLLNSAHLKGQTGMAAELVLAADQFIITPAGRVQDAARSHAAGDEVRTVIAGYHWFTDWGRDTMISLEGLTLTTGRHEEAGYILRTFAHYIRDGLIPNMFPEGHREGLYNTADATLWYFHAVDRYLEATGDRETLRLLLPKLMDIVDHHLKGTRFGICVDPKDGLVSQGTEGLPLTWMDAHVGDWVVTPRRGKAVEINALWYNALRLLERWVREEKGEEAAEPLSEHAAKCRRSFNQRFWYPDGGYLYDVIDAEEGENGNDPSCRPNQVLAVSLRHPVLDRNRWESVLQVVLEKLVTPVGLRSLSPDDPKYKAKYFGDRRARDAAYHQGTVWAWLIGPFIDAWLKLYPQDRAGARHFLEGFKSHLPEACIGSISEVFDADAPFTPRGCIAQAWSVAEVLRAWVKTAE